MITEIINFVNNNIKSKLNKENSNLVGSVRDKVNEKYQVVVDLNKIKKFKKGFKSSFKSSFKEDFNRELRKSFG